MTESTLLCILIIVSSRVISSVGRAPALQAGCRRFEPVIAHQNLWPRGVVVNMPACHAGDRRFKSDRGRQITCLGSSVGRAED